MNDRIGRGLQNALEVLVIIYIFCFFTNSVSAQTVWFNGGISFTKLDLKFTSLFGNDWQSYDSTANTANLALEFEFLERKKTSLSAEIGNYNIHYKAGSGQSATELKIPYLYLQQLINYYPIRFGNFKPQISAGIRVERISDKAKTQYSSLYYYEQEQLLNRTNFGLTGKIGFQYHQPKYGFKINFIYFHKLKNAIESKEGVAVNNYYSSIIGKETVSMLNFGLYLKLNRERSEFK